MQMLIKNLLKRFQTENWIASLARSSACSIPQKLSFSSISSISAFSTFLFSTYLSPLKILFCETHIPSLFLFLFGNHSLSLSMRSFSFKLTLFLCHSSEFKFSFRFFFPLNQFNTPTHKRHLNFPFHFIAFNLYGYMCPRTHLAIYL